jgi:hypothetical protein
VVDTGEPSLFEITVPGLGRTFEVRAGHESGQRFSCLFLDVTERKQGETRRLAIAELGDRLRPQAQLLDLTGVDRLEQVLASREVAVQRADPDVRLPGDVLQRRIRPVRGERLTGRGQHGVEVAARVRAVWAAGGDVEDRGRGAGHRD